MEVKEHFKGLSIPECIAKWEARVEETKQDWEWPLQDMAEQAIIERTKYLDEQHSYSDDKWLVYLPFDIYGWDYIVVEENKDCKDVDVLKIGKNENDEYRDKSVIGDDTLWLYKRLYCMGYFDPNYENNFIEGRKMI